MIGWAIFFGYLVVGGLAAAGAGKRLLKLSTYKSYYDRKAQLHAPVLFFMSLGVVLLWPLAVPVLGAMFVALRSHDKEQAEIKAAKRLADEAEELKRAEQALGLTPPERRPRYSLEDYYGLRDLDG